MTQEELAARSGVRRWKIVKLEADELENLRFGDVDRCVNVLDGRLYVAASYHGAAADRLLDELHAQVVAACIKLLAALGWQTRVEVSFNDFGDRGSIDVLAWHAPTRTLLVIEVKSELGSVEGTLRPLDVKVRVAPKLAGSRFGWHPAHVARLLVFPRDRTVARQIERHRDVVRSALPAESRQVLRWLRDPTGSCAGIVFVTIVQPVNGKRNPSAVRRVRRASPRSAQHDRVPDATSRRA